MSWCVGTKDKWAGIAYQIKMCYDAGPIHKRTCNQHQVQDLNILLWWATIYNMVLELNHSNTSPTWSHEWKNCLVQHRVNDAREYSSFSLSLSFCFLPTSITLPLPFHYPKSSHYQCLTDAPITKMEHFLSLQRTTWVSKTNSTSQMPVVSPYKFRVTTRKGMYRHKPSCPSVLPKKSITRDTYQEVSGSATTTSNPDITDERTYERCPYHHAHLPCYRKHLEEVVKGQRESPLQPQALDLNAQRPPTWLKV